MRRRPKKGVKQYDTYRPAYQYGWEACGRYQGRSFDEVEPELSRNWDTNKNKLSWDRAREATRDAWHRDAGRRRQRRLLAREGSRQQRARGGEFTSP